MPKAVEYTLEARTDFDESLDWYAEPDTGPAIGFALAVDDALELILPDPDRFPSTYGGCRYCLLKRYPFRIVFRDEPEHLVVIAVAHAKRDPDYWHDRM